MVNAYHTQTNREKIIATQQDIAGPISDEAKLRNVVTVEMLREEVKAWKLAKSSDVADFADLVRDGLNWIADMTPEMEQAMNEMILKKGG